MDANLPITLAWIAVSLFTIGVSGCVVAYLIPLSPKATRWLCNSGMVCFLILTITCGILHYWHHHLR